jgi:hypothetical protein
MIYVTIGKMLDKFPTEESKAAVDQLFLSSKVNW